MIEVDKKDETTVIQSRHNISQKGVDEGLIAMFIKMSFEERLKSNDNAVNTILELRNAFSRQKQFKNSKFK